MVCSAASPRRAINLPSQRLENNGQDPNVTLVPTGTHTWSAPRRGDARQHHQHPAVARSARRAPRDDVPRVGKRRDVGEGARSGSTSFFCARFFFPESPRRERGGARLTAASDSWTRRPGPARTRRARRAAHARRGGASRTRGGWRARRARGRRRGAYGDGLVPAGGTHVDFLPPMGWGPAGCARRVRRGRRGGHEHQHVTEYHQHGYHKHAAHAAYRRTRRTRRTRRGTTDDRDPRLRRRLERRHPRRRGPTRGTETHQPPRRRRRRCLPGRRRRGRSGATRGGGRRGYDLGRAGGGSRPPPAAASRRGGPGGGPAPPGAVRV